MFDAPSDFPPPLRDTAPDANDYATPEDLAWWVTGGTPPAIDPVAAPVEDRTAAWPWWCAIQAAGALPPADSAALLDVVEILGQACCPVDCGARNGCPLCRESLTQRTALAARVAALAAMLPTVHRIARLTDELPLDAPDLLDPAPTTAPLHAAPSAVCEPDEDPARAAEARRGQRERLRVTLRALLDRPLSKVARQARARG